MAEDLKIEISAEDLTAQAFANVQKQLGDIATATDASAKAMGGLAEQAGKLAQKGADLAGFGSNVVGMLRGGAIVGAIGLALNELHKFNDEIVQSIAKTVEQAATLNMTSERFQSYAYALAKANLAQGETASTLDKQKQQQKLALDGNAAAIEGYQNLGVKILDANGRLRDYSNITTEVARAILAMTDAEKQAAAAKDMLGLSGLRAIPALKQLAQSGDDLERSARAAHAILNEKLAKSIADSTVKSGQAALAVKGFYAEVAMPINMGFINLHIEAVAKIVGLMKDGTQWTREFYAALAGGASVAKAQVVAGLANMDAQSTRDKIAALEREIAEGAKPGSLEKYAPTHAPAGRAVQRMAEKQAELDRLRSGLGALEAQEAAARAAVAAAQTERERRMVASQIGLPIEPPVVTRSSFGGDKDPTVKPPPGGGAAGGDRIETAINRLLGEREAAETALERMMAGSHLPLADLERQIVLEKKIADEVARLGATKPDDPRIPQIKGLVTATQEAEAAFKKFDQASKEAEQTEKNLGDGTLYLRTEQQRLGEQLASRRLDLDTYGIAMQQASEKAEDMRLKNIGLQGGFEGLVAGMQHAANQWERNNRVFQNGEKIFQGVMSGLDQAIADFVQKGEINFGKLLQSFITMIIQMEARAAVSAVWTAIGGFAGIGAFLGIGGGGGSGANPAAQNYGGGTLNGGTMEYFAEGGDPPVGLPSLVGETGPELFVPKVPGTIFNQRQLAGMGGDSINIVQNFSFGSDVNQGTLRTWAEQIKKDTISSLVYAKRSGNAGLKKAFG